MLPGPSEYVSRSQNRVSLRIRTRTASATWSTSRAPGSGAALAALALRQVLPHPAAVCHACGLTIKQRSLYSDWGAGILPSQRWRNMLRKPLIMALSISAAGLTYAVAPHVATASDCDEECTTALTNIDPTIPPPPGVVCSIDGNTSLYRVSRSYPVIGETDSWVEGTTVVGGSCSRALSTAANASVTANGSTRANASPCPGSASCGSQVSVDGPLNPPGSNCVNGSGSIKGASTDEGTAEYIYPLACY